VTFDVLIGENAINQQKFKNCKLYMKKSTNPLIETKSDHIESEEDDEDNGLITIKLPGSIIYPETFNQLGISHETLFPGTTSNFSDGSFNIDPIMNNNQELSKEPGFIIINNAHQLINNPRVLVDKILSINHRLRPEKVLFLPGAAKVNNLSILAYLGVDIVDNIQCILQARLGNLMFGSGAFHYLNIDSDLCTCPGCVERIKLVHIKEHSDEQLFSSILQHNILSLKSELSLIKSSQEHGSLRELVEQRMVSEPYLTEIIRYLDLLYYDVLEPYFPIQMNQKYFAISREALNRVETVRFRKRIIDRYKKPEHSDILVLLPCSAKKPYFRSKTHKLFRTAINRALDGSNLDRTHDQSILIHEIIVTSPLGLVPRELELVYPAQQYDIPVTGSWFKDELDMIGNQLVQYLSKNRYSHVLIHLDRTLTSMIMKIIKEEIDPTPILRSTLSEKTQSPSSKGSLIILTQELHEILTDKSLKKNRNNKFDNYLRILESIARYQFGEPGIELIKGSRIKGRFPNLRILNLGKQFGMLTGNRGFISLTLAGAERLMEITGFNYMVEIDDFVPKGSVMCIGVVDASSDIRSGDEVVICHSGEIRGVGQAVISGSEMIANNRGPAVKVRHHIN
jgi:archaeosine synthase